MAQATCSVHGTIEANWKEGTSKKTGKPYGFWGCDNRMPDGGFCKGKVDVANTPSGKFDQSLDRAGAQMDAGKKDELITRTAIAKSILERGDHWGMETIKEAEAVLAWIKGTNSAMVQAMMKGSDSDASQNMPKFDTGGRTHADLDKEEVPLEKILEDLPF